MARPGFPRDTATGCFTDSTITNFSWHNPQRPFRPAWDASTSKVFEQFGQVAVIIFSEGMKGQVLLGKR
jgi:hypothetical protein